MVPKCIQYDHNNTLDAFLPSNIAFQKLTADIDPVTVGNSGHKNSLQTRVLLDFTSFSRLLERFSVTV